MPYFIALANLRTGQKHIIDFMPVFFDQLEMKKINKSYYDALGSKSGLPCGWYGLFRSFVRTDSNLNCEACNGTGGSEEISGGHKTECNKCFGSGVDPVLLNQFEDGNGGIVHKWPIHQSHCPECGPRP